MGLNTQAVYTGVFPNPGGGSVKLVQVDKVKSKRILAEVTVHASVEEVWAVLTDYDKLVEFVPNLEVCEKLPGGTATRYRLRQQGCSQSLYLRLEASALLDVQEVRGTMGRRELRFAMIESPNLKEFSGQWTVEPDPTVRDGRSLGTTKLRYEISVAPKWSIPSTLVSQVVKSGLPANICAIAERAEELARAKLEAPRFIAGALRDEAVSGLPGFQRRDIRGEVLPAKGPARAPWPKLHLQAPKINWEEAQKGRFGPGGYLGVTSVPLPAQQKPAPAPEADRAQVLAERHRQEDLVQASYPAIGSAKKSLLEALTEVHLRRLDTDDTLHRRAVAVIAIEAIPEEVWDVLTDYEALPEFVPNLALCERLAVPAALGTRLTRLRQVGFKDMMFMQLHAEAILDLHERPHQEIQFRAVAGDFGVLQGKFILSEPDFELRPLSLARRKETHLKYAVEVKIPRSTPMMGLLEPILERVVYEDIPFNLAALKQRVEDIKLQRRIAELEEQGEVNRAAYLRRRIERPRLAEMTEDFGLLAAELERCFGGTGTIPTRAQMRAIARTDLEKAIAAHGGPAAVAKRMGWNLAYKGKKPRGYWDKLANVQKEIDLFNKQQGLPPGIMPLKMDFVRANRYDLSHAVERWGGLYDLAELLDYQVLNLRGDNEWSQHVAETAAETGLSGTNGLFEVAARSYRLRRSQSSMDDSDSGSDDDLASGFGSNSNLDLNGRGRGGTQVIRTRSIINRISASSSSSSSSDSSNDEDGGTGTQVIRTRSGRRKNGAMRELASAGPENGVSNGAGSSSGEAGGNGNGQGRAAAIGRERGGMSTGKLKGPAPAAEERLRNEVDSW
ncbi:g4530 [Coccomyxa elongata]